MSDLGPGDKVKVVRGDYTGKEGTITEVDTDSGAFTVEFDGTRNDWGEGIAEEELQPAHPAPAGRA